MSYEGHYQALCQKGHQAAFPVLYCVEEEQAQRKAWRCSALVENQPCGAPVGEINSVDDTNGESYGIRKYIQLTEAVNKTCSLGHSHVWTAATYKFSSEQFYYNSETEELVSLSEEKI